MLWLTDDLHSTYELTRLRLPQIHDHLGITIRRLTSMSIMETCAPWRCYGPTHTRIKGKTCTVHPATMTDVAAEGPS